LTGEEAHTVTYATIATIIGYAAAALSTASFAPQVWKIIRAPETKDLSAGMYVLTVAGFTLWVAFGVLVRQWPLVVSNSLCLLLASFILLMKLLPPRKKQTVAQMVSPASP
jgi:MtN3 and saliva related transmembrane protein